MHNAVYLACKACKAIYRTSRSKEATILGHHVSTGFKTLICSGFHDIIPTLVIRPTILTAVYRFTAITNVTV